MGETMLKFLQNRLALSTKGAKDFCRGVIFTTILDISLMFPAMYLFLFLQDYLQPLWNPEQKFAHDLFFYVFLAGGFILVSFLIATLQYKSTFTLVYDESASRRISLAEKLRKLPLAFFGEKNLSDLTSTIMTDSTELEHTFSHAVPQLFASAISILLIVAGMSFYNWQLTLALFWVVPVALGFLLISKKKQHQDNQSLYQIKRDVSEKIQEGLETIQEIKSYHQEDKYLADLNKTLASYEKKLIRGELLIGGLVNVSQSILKLGLASVILVGATLLSTGAINVFTYLIFLVISSRIYHPVSEVFNNLAALFYLDVRIARMREMESLPVQQGLMDFNPQSYDLVFRQVDFSYEADKQVLQNVSFTAKQGEVTALVGPSGSGKSTAAKLCARFWDVDRGQILLGNQDISMIDPESLLKYYSVVFQDVVLFNASILENIRIGRRDASDEEIMHVARLAQCDTFIRELPDGYQTIIGENGETLSGGERQRISIARALLKNAPIILLDEATASLDVENESLIQAALSTLVRNKTVIIIAHRMRTIANADKIIVLDQGKVVEQGTPEELQKQKGLFARMLARQMQHSGDLQLAK